MHGGNGKEGKPLIRFPRKLGRSKIERKIEDNGRHQTLEK
jgi:hypothetical protein